MYKKRIDKVFDKITADALLITAQPEVFYLSGFTGDDTTLFITKDERFIITDSRYFIQAKEEANDFALIDISKKSVSDVVLESNCKKIGFLDKSLTYFGFERLKTKLEGREFVGVSDKIAEVRMIKDEEEIEKIKMAAKIADGSFSHILNFIKAGVKEKDIALELEFYMKKQGASALSFETICASGNRSAMPHGAASDKVIEIGDFVTLDFGCIYKGYASDMTRTVIVGEASETQRKIYDVVLSAQKEALSVIKEGKKASEIDKIARDIIKNAGYGENFGHGLGHSLGLLVHELPSLSPKSDAILKRNMLMTVEPGIYVENYGGVRIEDLVLIKEDGIENLTSSPKELIIL